MARRRKKKKSFESPADKAQRALLEENLKMIRQKGRGGKAGGQKVVEQSSRDSTPNSGDYTPEQEEIIKKMSPTSKTYEQLLQDERRTILKSVLKKRGIDA